MFLMALGRVLLIITILDVSLGGDGRLFDSGSVSPRMVLFGLGLAYLYGWSLKQQQGSNGTHIPRLPE